MVAFPLFVAAGDAKVTAKFGKLVLVGQVSIVGRSPYRKESRIAPPEAIVAALIV